ncbi:MAG: glycine cleavage system protein GcvH [bacterium]
MAKIKGYDFPDDLYYHQEHAWAKVEEGKKVRVGMSDFFQKEAGDVVYVDLPFEGDEVEQGETCGKIQSSKWIGKLVSPVSGTILEVNSDLEDESTLVNKDPYGKGWIMVVESSNLEADLKNLMQGEVLVSWIEGEIKKAEELRKKGKEGKET